MIKTPLCLYGGLLLTKRVSKLGEEKEKKSLTDLVIEKSVELYNFTPSERSDENINWMLENGYMSKKTQKHKRGTRGRRTKSERSKEIEHK